MQKLVSIITPCYNGEKFLDRYFNSILNQTYKNIELIFINDGSTDKTEEIALSYKEKLENNNIKVKYIYQENAGQAAAVNAGLKLFEGDYLTWPDSDDTLEPTSIEKKVHFLETNPQYGFVRTGANIIDDETNKIIGELKKQEEKLNEEIFEDLVFEINNIWFADGCYMVRKEAILKTIKNREIYIHRGGQNWQMLLPVAQKYKCGYIDEKLYNIYERKGSHSRLSLSINDELKRIKGYEEILENVLKELRVYEKYKTKLIIKYARRKFEIAIEFRNKKLIKDQFKILKKYNNLTWKDIVKYICVIIK